MPRLKISQITVILVVGILLSSSVNAISINNNDSMKNSEPEIVEIGIINFDILEGWNDSGHSRHGNFQYSLLAAENLNESHTDFSFSIKQLILPCEYINSSLDEEINSSIINFIESGVVGLYVNTDLFACDFSKDVAEFTANRGIPTFTCRHDEQSYQALVLDQYLETPIWQICNNERYNSGVALSNLVDSYGHNTSFIMPPSNFPESNNWCSVFKQYELNPTFMECGFEDYFPSEKICNKIQYNNSDLIFDPEMGQNILPSSYAESIVEYGCESLVMLGLTNYMAGNFLKQLEVLDFSGQIYIGGGGGSDFALAKEDLDDYSLLSGIKIVKSCPVISPTYSWENYQQNLSIWQSIGSELCVSQKMDGFSNLRFTDSSGFPTTYFGYYNSRPLTDAIEILGLAYIESYPSEDVNRYIHSSFRNWSGVSGIVSLANGQNAGPGSVICGLSYDNINDTLMPDCTDIFISPDSDSDGYRNHLDFFPLDANEWLDDDGDGIGNNADSDDDGDTVSDSLDAFPLDSTETNDNDGDGIGDNADTDDDNDGCLDVDDAFPMDAVECIDTDGDMLGNNIDDDDDNDGWADLEEVTCGSDSLDVNFFPADYDRDMVCDVMDLDDDNDGFNDDIDVFPMNSNESKDNDLDGIGDNEDPDDDNDGIYDQFDAFPLDSNRFLLEEKNVLSTNLIIIILLLVISALLIVIIIGVLGAKRKDAKRTGPSSPPPNRTKKQN